MAKLFGEFLVEKNFATTEQVLDAVITQLRSVSSTAEVIFDNALLQPADQLRILGHQQYAGTDFRTSAATLGLWTEELAEKVADLVQAKRRPLGEVLVELGFLSVQSLTQALDLYIEASAKPALITNPIPTQLVNRMSETKLDPFLTKEFVKSFETQIGPSIKRALEILQDQRLLQKDLMAALHSTKMEFVALRSAASFVSATQAAGLANELIVTVDSLLNNINEGHGLKVDVKILHEIFKLTIHVFNGICQLLRDFGSEDGIDGDPNLIDLIQRLASSQEHLRAQCNNTQRSA